MTMELKLIKKIEHVFGKAQRELQAKIDSWYVRLAKNNNISILEAKRLLSADELKEFKWNVKEFIKHGRENAINQKWVKELENASAKFHISRFEALKVHAQQELERAFGNELDEVDKMARDIYTNNYYHSIFEIQKGTGIGFNIGSIDTNKLDKIIVKPWNADGKNFSDRIWQKKSEMVNNLHQELTRNVLLGKSPDEAIKHMEKFVDESIKNAKYCAGRLIMTEEAYFHSVSQKEAFNDLNVEEFEIVATLDNRTSEICREMDGKHFLMKDYQAGITAPPFHCFCRSITCPYFNDEWSKGERIARGEDGKTYYVPEDMKYKEWKKKYVDKTEKSDIIGDEKIKLTEIITESETARDKGEKIPMKDVILEEIDKKNWTPEFKSKAVELYKKASEEGVRFSSHGIGRTIQRVINNYLLSQRDIIELLKNSPAYLQDDGKLIYNKNNVYFIRDEETMDIVSVVIRNKPKREWGEYND